MTTCMNCSHCRSVDLWGESAFENHGVWFEKSHIYFENDCIQSLALIVDSNSRTSFA
jgi:hypothetical protein